MGGTCLTSPAGTDTVFLDGGQLTPERFSEDADGAATPPGGQVYMAPGETSAEGHVVVPKARCRFQHMTGVSLSIAQVKLKAEQGGGCFGETMAAGTGPKTCSGTL